MASTILEPTEFRIGIAPTPEVEPVGDPMTLHFVAANPNAGKTPPPIKLAMIDDDAPSDPPRLVNIHGGDLNPLTWPDYLAWRKTKCKPRKNDRGELEAYAEENHEHVGESYIRERWPKQDWIEEIDQATHELVGEAAELAELFLDNGLATFFGDFRTKLIDECGDIFFCGAWALDAWGINPLADLDDLELVRIADDSFLALFTEGIAAHTLEQVAENHQFTAALQRLTNILLIDIQTSAGLTSNAFKKLKFQRRDQAASVQVGRLMKALTTVNTLLIVANSSVEEALKTNQRKLNARFPEGYKPGVGGGIRTGAGK